MYLFISVTSSLYGYQHGFGRGTGTITLNHLYCTGTESSLLSCRTGSGIRFGYCSGDAGVVCPCEFDVIIRQFILNDVGGLCYNTQVPMEQ